MEGKIRAIRTKHRITQSERQILIALTKAAVFGVLAVTILLALVNGMALLTTVYNPYG